MGNFQKLFQKINTLDIFEYFGKFLELNHFEKS